MKLISMAINLQKKLLDQMLYWGYSMKLAYMSNGVYSFISINSLVKNLE